MQSLHAVLTFFSILCGGALSAVLPLPVSYLELLDRDTSNIVSSNLGIHDLISFHTVPEIASIESESLNLVRQVLAKCPESVKVLLPVAARVIPIEGTVHELQVQKLSDSCISDLMTLPFESQSSITSLSLAIDEINKEFLERLLRIPSLSKLSIDLLLMFNSDKKKLARILSVVDAVKPNISTLELNHLQSPLYSMIRNYTQHLPILSIVVSSDVDASEESRLFSQLLDFYPKLSSLDVRRSILNKNELIHSDLVQRLQGVAADIADLEHFWSVKSFSGVLDMPVSTLLMRKNQYKQLDLVIYDDVFPEDWRVSVIDKIFSKQVGSLHSLSLRFKGPRSNIWNLVHPSLQRYLSFHQPGFHLTLDFTSLPGIPDLSVLPSLRVTSFEYIGSMQYYSIMGTPPAEHLILFIKASPNLRTLSLNLTDHCSFSWFKVDHLMSEPFRFLRFYEWLVDAILKSPSLVYLNVAGRFEFLEEVGIDGYKPYIQEFLYTTQKLLNLDRIFYLNGIEVRQFVARVEYSIELMTSLKSRYFQLSY